MGQIASSIPVSADELHDAYVFCKLRRIGIGYLKAIETPCVLRALHNVVQARKKAQQQNGTPAPVSQAI